MSHLGHLGPVGTFGFRWWRRVGSGAGCSAGLGWRSLARVVGPGGSRQEISAETVHLVGASSMEARSHGVGLGPRLLRRLDPGRLELRLERPLVGFIFLSL